MTVTPPHRFMLNLAPHRFMPRTQLWRDLATFPKRRPFATNLGLSFVVAGLSDYMAQTAEGNQKLDKRRIATLSMFGVSMGFLHWHLYVTIFARLFPRAVTFANLKWAEKVADKAG